MPWRAAEPPGSANTQLMRERTSGVSLWRDKRRCAAGAAHGSGGRWPPSAARTPHGGRRSRARRRGGAQRDALGDTWHGGRRRPQPHPTSLGSKSSSWGGPGPLPPHLPRPLLPFWKSARSWLTAVVPLGQPAQLSSERRSESPCSRVRRRAGASNTSRAAPLARSRSHPHATLRLPALPLPPSAPAALLPPAAAAVCALPVPDDECDAPCFARRHLPIRLPVDPLLDRCAAAQPSSAQQTSLPPQKKKQPSF